MSSRTNSSTSPPKASYWHGQNQLVEPADSWRPNWAAGEHGAASFGIQVDMNWRVARNMTPFWAPNSFGVWGFVLREADCFPYGS